MARGWLAGTIIVGVCAFGVLIERGPAHSQPIEFHSIPGNAAAGRHQRVNADIARRIATWRGTSDCRSTKRARSAVKPAAAGWLGKLVVARPREKLVKWGYHSGDIWAENRIQDGKAQCVAGFRKLIVYADFKR